MRRWTVVAVVLAGASACSSSNKKACENIFKVTTGAASADKGGSFLEMCLQNQTTDRLGIYCKNPQALLDCAASAGDKDALGKCKDQCQRKSCTEVVKAVIAKAGDRFDDATQEAMLKKAEGDLGCSPHFDNFTFP
jgi:hypothetical protein